MSATDTVAWPNLLLSCTTAIVAVSVILFYNPGVGWRIQWTPLHLFTRLQQRAMKSHYGTTASSPLFALERALDSYEAYGRMARAELQKQNELVRRLPGRHQHLARRIGYCEKILKCDFAVALNENLTIAIVRQARAYIAMGLLPKVINCASRQPDLGRVREALKHIARDWSDEGREEREQTFAPVLEELAKVAPEDRSQVHILVPGSGLGRLAWEIAQLGFHTTSCELSYYMSLALNFIMSPESTERVNQHRLCPFSHWWSHQRSSSNTFREISFPDILPRRIANWTVVEGDFLGLMDSKYDIIVTLFFLDTSSNIISYLSHIHHLLKPGGKLINLGPLLYHGASLELSFEELLSLMDLMGFEVDHTSVKTVPSEYTADTQAMMRWIYQAEFWVATKRVDSAKLPGAERNLY